MATSKKELDREVKTRKAERTVKSSVKAAAQKTPSKEVARQTREVKTRIAEKAVKGAVQKMTAKAPKAAPSAAGSIGDKLKSFVKTAASQIKTGVKDVIKKPGQMAARAVKSLPQGRSAKILLGGAAGATAAFAGGKALSNSKAAPKKPPAKASSSSNSDVPEYNSSIPGYVAPSKKPAAKTPASSKGGAKYPVYKKDSANAASFRSAFAAARKAGKGEFSWEGRKYNTKVKGK